MINVTKPIISVIVAIYQVDKYLDKCLSSLISQSYRNLQIILVDDGSFDNSSFICNKYAQMDNRVEVYHKTNGGLVSARKFGIEKAKGSYIAFVDGDDYVDEDMYDILLATILETNADFVTSGYKDVTNGRVSKNENVNSFECVVKTDFDRCNLIDASFFGRRRDRLIKPSIWSKLFKFEFIKECYSYVPDKQDYGEDLICLYCCLLKCHKVVSISTSSYNYTVRKGSLSNIEKEDLFFNELRLYNVLCDINKKQFNSLEDNYMYMWIREKVKNLMVKTADSNTQFGMVQYYIKDISKIEQKKVVLYGLGTVGMNYLSQLINYASCNVVGVIDKNWEKKKMSFVDVYPPENITNLEFDFVVIALYDELDARDAKERLVSNGVDPLKIIWDRPCI